MPDPEKAAEFAARARFREEVVFPKPDAVASPVDVIRARRSIGTPIPTGIPTLDKRMGGGIPPGRSIVLGAPPGLGKTGLLTQILTKMALKGYTVAALFADEGRDAAAVRIGQNLGLGRFKLEAGDEEAARTLDEKLDGCLFLLPDPDDEVTTVEWVARIARSRAPAGTPIVLGFDSIQTVRSEGAEDASDQRVLVKETASAIQRLKKPLDAVVIAISEVNRSAYRSRNEADRATPLSSFSESSRIEYAFDVAVFIDGDPEDEIRLRIVKNRLGPKGKPFHLKFCPERATFTEVDEEERERTRREDDAASHRAQVEERKGAIRDHLTRYPDGRSTLEIRGVLTVRRKLAIEVLASMEAAGEIESRRVPGRGQGLRWHLTRSHPPPPAGNDEKS